MPISFFSEETPFTLKGKKEITQWIKNVAGSYNKKVGEINYVFCDDDFLLRMNQEHLQHDTYTDIITFDYSEETTIEGDIYVSIDRVRENAETFQQPFEQELRRVMIHGVLHLVGYKDKTDDEEKQMRALESKHLEAFPK
jgi:probable rRNA maturation factor